MYTAQQKNMGPFVIRYPRGNGTTVNWRQPFKSISVGKGQKIKDGDEIAILSIGPIGNEAIKTTLELESSGINIAHYDMRFIKPLDEELLHKICKTHKKLVTLEDGCLHGGMGSAVLEFMSDNGYSLQVKRLGIPDKFIEHGSQKELYKECGYDSNAIRETIISLVNSKISI